MSGGGSVAYHREPCPGRIFEDLGVGFSIGCLGGTVFYFFKGMNLVSFAILNNYLSYAFSSL